MSILDCFFTVEHDYWAFYFWSMFARRIISDQCGQGVQFCRFLCLHVAKLTKCWNAITPQNGQSRSIIFSDKGKWNIAPSVIVRWIFMEWLSILRAPSTRFYLIIFFSYLVLTLALPLCAIVSIPKFIRAGQANSYESGMVVAHHLRWSRCNKYTVYLLYNRIKNYISLWPNVMWASRS